MANAHIDRTPQCFAWAAANIEISKRSFIFTPAARGSISIDGSHPGFASGTLIFTLAAEVQFRLTGLTRATHPEL